MERLLPLEKDYYCVEDDHSDRECGSESSDDEIQESFVSVAGVSRLENKRSSRRDNDEDFESEMEKELTVAFNARNCAWFRDSNSIQQISQKESNIKEEAQNDDEELQHNEEEIASDDEFCAKEGIDKDGVDIFYDPSSDQDNQNWVDSHRKSVSHSSQRLPNSDAVLNCPCCMGVLCYDCQRHDVYHTQYRAMFAVNCEVQKNQVLFQPDSKNRSKKSRIQKELNIKSGQKLNIVPEGCDPDDIFQPVVCTHCKTEVAVYDNNEIYHFFNVLASYT